MAGDREERAPSLESELWPYRKALRVLYAKETGRPAFGDRYLFWLENELARAIAKREEEGAGEQSQPGN